MSGAALGQLGLSFFVEFASEHWVSYFSTSSLLGSSFFPPGSCFPQGSSCFSAEFSCFSWELGNLA